MILLRLLISHLCCQSPRNFLYNIFPLELFLIVTYLLRLHSFFWRSGLS